MTGVLAGALVVMAVTATWRIRVLGRDVAALRQTVQGRASAQVRARHDQFWEDVRRLHRDHTSAVEARVNRVEASVTRIAGAHSRLDRRLEAVEPWVEHWALAAQDDKR
jgi:hypothetical protein